MGIVKDILYKIQMQNIDCKCEWLVGVFNHWWVGVIIVLIHVSE